MASISVTEYGPLSTAGAQYFPPLWGKGLYDTHADLPLPTVEKPETASAGWCSPEHCIHQLRSSILSSGNTVSCQALQLLLLPLAQG